MAALNINRMPSSQEIKFVMKSTKLVNAIRRHGGYYYWAEKLKIPIKECETKLGKKYETILKNILQDKGCKVQQMSFKHPYDLLVNENTKIDVKASRKYFYTKNQYYYTFNIEKENPTCDIYACFCINNASNISKLLIIPSKFLHLTQLSIGDKSKYDKYIDRWDYIEQFNEFYKKLA